MTITCPKCRAVSGDDWSQCIGGCPMAGSPSYDEYVSRLYGESPDDAPFSQIDADALREAMTVVLEWTPSDPFGSTDWYRK